MHKTSKENTSQPENTSSNVQQINIHTAHHVQSKYRCINTQLHHIPFPLKCQTGKLGCQNVGQKRGLSRQPICVAIIAGTAMSHSQSVGLHCQGPLREEPIGILHLLKPSEWLMIGMHCEMPSLEVHVERNEHLSWSLVQGSPSDFSSHHPLWLGHRCLQALLPPSATSSLFPSTRYPDFQIARALGTLTMTAPTVSSDILLNRDFLILPPLTEPISQPVCPLTVGTH